MLIATPDHWHSPMTIEAIAAGKDVYCEKPVSNDIEPAVKMLEAVRKSNRIVQIGTQQRSWHHFQEAAKLFHEDYIGTSVNHCQMCPPGGGGGGGGGQQAQPQGPQPIPAGFNWEMFQGPAKRKPFVPGRRSWRGWYDYGGGNLTDWGVHLTDVMNWYMKTDNKAPLLTSASAQYIRIPRDPERVPDTYAVTWQFENFVATLSNAMVPGGADRATGTATIFSASAACCSSTASATKSCRTRPRSRTAAAADRPNAPPAPPPPPPLEAEEVQGSVGQHVGGGRFLVRIGHPQARPQLPRLGEVAAAAQSATSKSASTRRCPTLLAIVSVKEGRHGEVGREGGTNNVVSPGATGGSVRVDGREGTSSRPFLTGNEAGAAPRQGLNRAA